MQGALQANEIVEGIGFVVEKQYNGMEGIVTEDLGVGWCTFSENLNEELFEAHTYVVSWENGDETTNLRSNLKRKKPPTDGYKGETIVFDLFKCKQNFLEECV